jgi:hypothetical protein
VIPKSRNKSNKSTFYAILKKLSKKFTDDYLNNQKDIQKFSNPGINLKELDKKIDPIIERIPSPEEIFQEGVEKIRNEYPDILGKKYIKNNFSECVTKLESTAFSLYLQYEKEMFYEGIEFWIQENEEKLTQLYKKIKDPAKFANEVCKRIYPLIQRIEFRAGQKRKARGGGTFELVFGYLLHELGIQCEKPKGKARKTLKRIDLVIPDQKTALTHPDKAFFLSCKRTLRERWKQTIPERKPSWRVFLTTVDESLPEEKAKEIDELGLIIFVRDKLKNKPHLINKTWVRKLSSLPMNIKI